MERSTKSERRDAARRAARERRIVFYNGKTESRTARRRAALAAGRAFTAAFQRTNHGSISEKDQDTQGKIALADIEKSHPGGFAGFAEEYRESRPCLLCGGPATTVGLFAPPYPAFLNAPEGMFRVTAYTLCDECQRAPGCYEAVEAILYNSRNPAQGGLC